MSWPESAALSLSFDALPTVMPIGWLSKMAEREGFEPSVRF